MWRRLSAGLLSLLLLFQSSWVVYGSEPGSDREKLLRLAEIFKQQRIELGILQESLQQQKMSKDALQRLLSEREEKLRQLSIELESLQHSLSESEASSESLRIALQQARERLDALTDSLEKAKASLKAYSRKKIRDQIITGVACLFGGIAIGVMIP